MGLRFAYLKRKVNNNFISVYFNYNYITLHEQTHKNKGNKLSVSFITVYCEENYN